MAYLIEAERALRAAAAPYIFGTAQLGGVHERARRLDTAVTVLQAVVECLPKREGRWAEASQGTERRLHDWQPANEAHVLAALPRSPCLHMI